MDELMKKVLGDNSFTDWGDYNRRYGDYIFNENLKRSQSEHRKDCLHGGTPIILPDGRKQCPRCGKRQN